MASLRPRAIRLGEKGKWQACVPGPSVRVRKANGKLASPVGPDWAVRAFARIRLALRIDDEPDDRDAAEGEHGASKLLQEVGSRPLEELPDQPGFYRSECLLAQYSPFDPETGVWRRVEIFLRKKGRQYEVYDVRGLKIRRETAS